MGRAHIPSSEASVETEATRVGGGCNLVKNDDIQTSHFCKTIYNVYLINQKIFISRFLPQYETLRRSSQSNAIK